MKVQAKQQKGRRPSSQRKLLLCAGMVSAALVQRGGHRAGAATIRDDTPDSSYTALSAQSQYAASGYVEVNGGQVFGSGTLIAPDWVLTAAHVVTQDSGSYAAYLPSQVTFSMGPHIGTSVSYSVSAVVVEPGWSYNLGAGDDLALLELSTPVTGVTPATLYNSSLGTELGQTATIIGYGMTGTGLTGAISSAGTRRGITNVIDSFGGQAAGGLASVGISSNLMFTDFDQPNNPLASNMGSSTPTTLEGASAPGDSGGGVFLTVNNQTYLAGVTDFLGVLPTNLLSPNADGHYGDYNGYTRVSVPQSMTFIDSSLIQDSWWNTNGGGSWASLGNWAGTAIPEYAGAVAGFGTTVAINSTITLDGNWTVGALTFDNTNSYTLSPGTHGILTLDNGGASATGTITDTAGTHCINAPLVLNSNVLITVDNAGDTMKMWGGISGVGGLTVTGAGAVQLTGTNTYQGPTTITSGTLTVQGSSSLPSNNIVVNNGSVVFKGNATVGSLTGMGSLMVGTSTYTPVVKLATNSGANWESSVTVNPGATLDISNNVLGIFYSGQSPEAAIAAALSSGYNGGTWTGTGITSSVAAANPTRLSVGYVDGSLDKGTSAQPNEVLVAYTIPGDANLDGTVNFSDLGIVAQHLGTTGNDWSQGNFTYDPTGYVGFTDLGIIGQNLNQTVGTIESKLGLNLTVISTNIQQTQFTDTSLPEPAFLGFGAICGLLLARRARRGTSSDLTGNRVV